MRNQSGAHRAAARRDQTRRTTVARVGAGGAGERAPMSATYCEGLWIERAGYSATGGDTACSVVRDVTATTAAPFGRSQHSDLPRRPASATLAAAALGPALADSPCWCAATAPGPLCPIGWACDMSDLRWCALCCGQCRPGDPLPDTALHITAHVRASAGVLVKSTTSTAPTTWRIRPNTHRG